jgi:hypothetical protein
MQRPAMKCLYLLAPRGLMPFAVANALLSTIDRSVNARTALRDT